MVVYAWGDNKAHHVEWKGERGGEEGQTFSAPVIVSGWLMRAHTSAQCAQSKRMRINKFSPCHDASCPKLVEGILAPAVAKLR